MTMVMIDQNLELVSRFALNLAQLRQAGELTQEELALRSGVDRTFISGCERGVRNPSLKTLERIALGLGVDAAELLRPEK